MSRRISPEPPNWMEAEPQPQLEKQRFHDQSILVWVGEVDIRKIEGWQGNPRTELLRDQFLETYAREPTNEEMCQLALDDDDEKEGLKIKELAASILKNGVRVPIVLTYSKKLLDGNRRYYASTSLLTEGGSRKNRIEFAKIPAFVLPKGTPPEMEEAILTEYNFAPSMQLEWPYYIRARRVQRDHDEYGLNKEELQQKYGGIPWRYLSKWIAAARLCDQFLKHHDETFTARQFAFRNFIMFDEMERNYHQRLREGEFRRAIFNVLLDGYEPENHKHHKFSKSADTVRLDEIYDSEDAWQALTHGRGEKALKEALGILEMSSLGGSADPNPALKRIVKGLEKLVKNRSLVSADQELLQTFRDHSQQVPGGPNDPAAQIEQMLDWLEEMSALQIAELDKASIARLRRALAIVTEVAEAVEKAEGVNDKSR
jgi:hypothetical protein